MFQVLKGHSSAVTHIIVNSDKGEIISAAQDKVNLLSCYLFVRNKLTMHGITAK